MNPPLKAFVINLPERSDRLKEFKERFRNWNLDLEVVPGVKDAEPWKGCTKSHLAVVQKAKAAGLPWVLILEDDAAPTEPTPDRFNALLPILWSKRAEWEVFNGGPSNLKREELALVQKEPPLLKVKGQAAHFYILNASAYDKVLTANAEPNLQIIDLYYRENLTMWSTYPYIAVQAPGHSSIERKSVDYVPGLKQSETMLKAVLNSQAGGYRRRTIRKQKKRHYRRKKTRKQRGGQQAPTFHVLIATAGRPTLKRMLDSLKPQLSEKDALTIVFDGKASKGKSGFADTWKEGFKCPVAIFEEEPALGHWGHGIRNKYQGILKPETTYIMHADDDDQYAPNAFEVLRSKCVKPECLYVIRFNTLEGKILPSPGTTSVQQGNIGTPCGIVPFKSATKSMWGTDYGGDGVYYTGLSSAIGCTEFLDDVLYNVMK